MSQAVISLLLSYNNPHPTRAALATEASADALLASHARAVAAFQALVRDAIAKVRAIEFPLGSPASGYDVDDIESFLGDWLIAPRQELTEALALDVAREAVELRSFDAAEAAR
jgi:hypothetical protein